jgi:hypothetical protein
MSPISIRLPVPCEPATYTCAHTHLIVGSLSPISHLSSVPKPLLLPTHPFPPGTPSHLPRPSLQHSHSYFSTRTPGSPSLERERPALLHRNTSYSRRHASVDSPREVPLPSMHSLPHQHNDHQHRPQETLGDFFHNHMGKGTSGLSGEQISGEPNSSDPRALSFRLNTFSAVAEPRQAQPHPMDTTDDGSLSSARISPLSSSQHYTRRSPSGNVPLQGGRPISAQDAARPIYSPTPVRAGMNVDRSSTHSLPVPMHMPYHTLPSVFQQGSSQGETSASSASSSAPTINPSFSQRPPSSSSSSRRPAYMAREDTLPRYDAAGIPFTSTKPPSPSSNTRAFSPLVMSDDNSYMPAPVPPTILTPPPPPAQDGRHHAPHEPFLARSSPRSTEIRVETSRRDYKLIVRLPGYRRDSM